MTSPDTSSAISYVDLHTIDNRIGYETSRVIDKNNNNNVIINFKINPYRDLLIANSVRFEACVPLDYQKNGGLTVKLMDNDMAIHYKDIINTGDSSSKSNSINSDSHANGNSNSASNSSDVNGVLLDIKWLGRVKYPLSVWFYTVRNYLRNKTTHQWTSSPLLRSEFYITSINTTPLFSNSEQNKVVIRHGVGSTQGRRPYMEDTNFIFDTIRINDKNIVSAYGVLDGHGGKDCAQYAADEIPMNVTKYIRTNKNCCEALFLSFNDTDIEFLSSNSDNNSGCTANCMVYDRKDNCFYVGNTGDTRAVLCRNSVAYDLTIDRKATDPEEIARIARNGGFVMNGRVMGSLAVARAIGDASLKNPRKKILIPDPEMSQYRPSVGDEFILIATDGLWDVMSSQQAVTFTREQLLHEGVICKYSVIVVCLVVYSTTPPLYLLFCICFHEVVLILLTVFVLVPKEADAESDLFGGNLGDSLKFGEIGDFLIDKTGYGSNNGVKSSGKSSSQLPDKEIANALKKIAQLLSEHAVNKLNSMDNVTVMILLLSNLDHLPERPTSAPTVVFTSINRESSSKKLGTSTTSDFTTSSQKYNYDKNINNSYSSKDTSITSNSTTSAKLVSTEDSGMDDDLLDFLNDDSNF